MNKYFKGLALFASFSPLLLTLAVPSLALAQTPTVGLQIKPAIVEDNVNPGEGHQYSLNVTNISGTAKTLYVLVKDIKGVDAEGRPIFTTTGETTGFELSSWVSLPVTTIQLNAGESRSVSFGVLVPAKASPGSHFASVLFSDKPTAPSTSGTGVGFGVGAIVSLRISGDVIEQATLKEFSTGKLIYPNATVDFNTTVANGGNILVQPTGVIQITNMFGKQVGNITVNDQQSSVFPGSDRSYATTWTGSGFAFGRYEAVGSFAYGEDARKTISGTTSFWILPLVPIAIVLGVFLALVITAYVLMKSYISRKLRQMGVSTANRSEADLYQRKYQKSGSRLIVVTFVIILICVLFLMALFLLFA